MYGIANEKNPRQRRIVDHRLKRGILCQGGRAKAKDDDETEKSRGVHEACIVAPAESRIKSGEAKRIATRSPFREPGADVRGAGPRKRGAVSQREE